MVALGKQPGKRETHARTHTHTMQRFAYHLLALAAILAFAPFAALAQTATTGSTGATTGTTTGTTTGVVTTGVVATTGAAASTAAASSSTIAGGPLAVIIAVSAVAAVGIGFAVWTMVQNGNRDGFQRMGRN